MKKLVVMVAALALVLGLAAVSQAADKAGKPTVGLDLGVAIPVGDFGDTCGSSFVIGVNGGYWINNMIEAGLGLLSNVSHGINHTNVSENILAITPQVKVTPIDDKLLPNLSPNLQAGLGLFRVADGDSEMKFGFGIGAGADYNINKNLSAGITLKYNLILTDPNSWSYISLLLGASYNF